MNDALIGALGALGGATLTSIATIFGPSIRDFFRKTDRKSSLVGEWSCEWHIKEPRGHETPLIEDTVTVTKCSTDHIRAHGHNTIAGKFEISGRQTEFAVSLVWHHPGENRDLLGSVLLKKYPGPRLEGHWNQIGRKGQLIRGTTIWTKKQ